MSVGHRQFVLLSENYRNLQKKANRFPPFRSNLGTEVSPGIPLAPAVLLEGVNIRGDARPGTLSEKGPGQQPGEEGREGTPPESQGCLTRLPLQEGESEASAGLCCTPFS